jgi:putative endonuclease
MAFYRLLWSKINMFYVYIIQSITYPDKFYYGFTHNLAQRLEYHNAGKSLYTKVYKPWKIIAYFAFDTQEKATSFEKYLKTGSGYEFIRRRIL